jgi:UDP-N-acetylmuramyl pentapeptide phosphotransferase/UDP-N-acetylglucosamine-1-phosphate transferase
MDLFLFLALGGVVFLSSLIGTGAIIPVLGAKGILDQPNERSSHSMPTPKGGGIVVIACIAVAWAMMATAAPQAGIILAVIAAALALALLSWADDLKGLDPFARLLGQAAAVAFVLFSPFSEPFFAGPYFGGLLPGWLDAVLAGLVWLWFINLFNFMDGIDGIAGVETACVGIGIALVAVAAGLAAPFGAFGLTIAAAALGFLWWNWHPARIFLGDVGSVPLGYLLGWLLLGLAQNGEWAAALILPLYYLADATITLLRRGVRGEKVWQAHRLHFYQHAVKTGLDHGQVVRHVLFVNLLLVALAVAAARGWVWASLICALVAVSGLLFFLSRNHPAARPAEDEQGPPS